MRQGNSTVLVISAHILLLAYLLGLVARLFFVIRTRHCATLFARHTRLTRIMEVDVEYQNEPMDVDDLEGTTQGLPFPHIIGEDGQHTVQHIDM
jgi:hypothetical protein